MHARYHTHHNPTLSAKHPLPQIRVFVYGSVLQCIAVVAVCCKVVLCVAQDQKPSKLFSNSHQAALHAMHNFFNMTKISFDMNVCDTESVRARESECGRLADLIHGEEKASAINCKLLLSTALAIPDNGWHD